ncbi:MAG TPA: MotA/TolQ/ExbB proton channel family protein [Armatimonadota bacterium]|nr:MotA/TolQ/ExbB proton channel family protein [Armatimonadota bacterium]
MVWLFNAFDFLCKGGPVMAPLMLCSIVSITVIIERYVRLKQAAGDSVSLTARVEDLLALGKYREAIHTCERDGTPLGNMLASGLKCSDARQAERCMEEQALKAMPEAYKRLSILDTIVTIAPLLGLLGTVTGMIRSFHVISTKTGLGTPTAITGGVAEALIATATGLAIAIVTLVAYNSLIERAKIIMSELETYGTRMVNTLSSGEEWKHEAKAVGA